MATTPDVTHTYNTDIFGLIRRMNRFIIEIVKSQSSNVSVTQPFDAQRMLSYLAAITSYQAWVTTQPLLDLPETAPQPIALLPDPELTVIENESLYDLAMMITLARDELKGSQSSRLSTNLMKFDSDRLSAVMLKCNNFINDYISKVDPIDLPESSPMTPVSTAGARGV